MRAIVVSRTGGPEVLELVQVARPEPGPGELLVRV
ncbi:MAG: NADPH:quinone oxidoreductase, partial [Longimicrobiales bacterium]